MSENIFLHGGRLGDTVMALYAVKKLGGGVFQMCARHEYPYGKDQLLSMLRLVEYQSYIKRALHVNVPLKYMKTSRSVNQPGYAQLTPDENMFSGITPLPWTHSFIDAENWIKSDYDARLIYPECSAAGKNWIHVIHQAQHHSRFFNVEWKPDTVWLEAPATKTGVDIVFHAPSYRLVRSRESWCKILVELSKSRNVVILTGERDRDDWISISNDVMTIVPPDFLETADYINSAKCLLGAASSCYCVAEALRKLRFIELKTDCYNTYCYGETGKIINDLTDEQLVEHVLQATI